MNKVLVLMSTYNGEKYIANQLDSLMSQKNVLCDILIRDDGSSDKTRDIIKEYSKVYNNITYYFGENIGYAKSFWDLIKKASLEYEYYAFCDQDDIWMNNKLFRATEILSLENYNGPLLYTSDVIAVNNNCEIISERLFGKKQVLSFSESLQKSILPGCTFVFNKEAIFFAKKYNGYMESHDWLLYAIVSATGRVVFDDDSFIYYRIHENNTIGKANLFRLMRNRIKRFFHKSRCVRSNMAKDIYETYSESMNDRNKKNCYLLANYKTDHKKLSLVFNKDFKGIVFKLYALLGKV